MFIWKARKTGGKSVKQLFQETILTYLILGPPHRHMHKTEVDNHNSKIGDAKII